MLDLAACDREVFNHGTAVFVTHTVPAKEIERFVKAAASLSGQRVDWSYYGGRAVIRCLGDASAVTESIKYLMPVLLCAYQKAVASYGCRTAGDDEQCGYFLAEAAKGEE